MRRVMIFDDHRDRRESLEALLSDAPGVMCVGSYEDCVRIKEQVSERRPDIILMDLRMPGLDGVAATRIVKGIDPSIKVVIQTVYDDDDNIFDSLRAGAEGYILKNTGEEKVLQSIQDVCNGGAVITPSIALRVARYFNDSAKARQGEAELTPREKEVLSLLTDGLSYKMVASRLGISYNTVNSHVKKIYDKLSVNSVGEAISMAIKNRLV
jgi:two-component system nitrate/nitrite response regulator NarL